MIPEFLMEKLKAQYGNENGEAHGEAQKNPENLLLNEIIKGYYSKRKTTLRVNTLKSTLEEVTKVLKENNINFSRVPWYNEALIIEKSPDVFKANEKLKSNLNKNHDGKEELNEKEICEFEKNDILRKIQSLGIYKEGKIYIQSLSSMIPPLVLSPQKHENILDMTAAPGSKTSEIATLSNDECFIMACEMNKIRCERLKYNLEKQGVKKATVMQTDARNLDEFFSFDKILLDAPCSGSGTLNFSQERCSLETEKLKFEKLKFEKLKSGESETEKLESGKMKSEKLKSEKGEFKKNKGFTQKLIDKSVKSQKKLIDKAIKLLAKGGILVYSTCSILKEENEEIIKYALRNKNMEIVPIKLENLALDNSELGNLTLESFTLEDSGPNVLEDLSLENNWIYQNGMLTILPSSEYEGFFVAKLNKIK